MWPEQHYTPPGSTLADALTRLTHHIEQVPVRMKALPIDYRQQARQPGKWSRQEVVGHLVDSALNNLRRFTEAQFAPRPYRIQSYDQQALVLVNGYGQMPIDELLTLWQALNRQILRVASAIPTEKLTYPIVFPNSDRTYSLAWLVEDYVGHLEHHLDQLR